MEGLPLALTKEGGPPGKTRLFGAALERAAAAAVATATSASFFAARNMALLLLRGVMAGARAVLMGVGAEATGVGGVEVESVDE